MGFDTCQRAFNLAKIFFVTIDYMFLGLALVILWFPRQWLRVGRTATRQLRWLRRSRAKASDPSQIREPGDSRLALREEFSKPRNYIDFLRALTGGLLLIGNGEWGIEPCITLKTEHLLQGSEGDFLTYARMALLLVGVLIQFLRHEARLTFYAPIFYLGGLGFALCGFNAGFFAFLVGWTINTAAPLSPAGFLSLYALLMFMLGLLFRGVSDSYVIFAGAVSFLPVMVSLLARRSLALFTKRIK
jgi:hypothetical protein